MQDYVALRKPFLLNDLAMQIRLLDRVEVYKSVERRAAEPSSPKLLILLPHNIFFTPRSILRENDIPVPPHVFLDRSDKTQVVEEKEDSVTVNGVTIAKPFVVKPQNAEDHDVRPARKNAVPTGI